MWKSFDLAMPRFSILALLLLLLLPPAMVAERAIIAGPTHPNGTEAICDLPNEEHIKNTGGRDGSGLCVFSSIEMAGRYQNAEELRGFQEKMRKELGGGYPSKVDVMMKRYAPNTPYIQYEGSSLEILDLAMKTGRMASVTYGYSERYGGRVAHMVNLVHLDQNLAAILDNNFIKTIEWMPREEFLRRWRMTGGGWTVILLNPSPNPIPVN